MAAKTNTKVKGNAESAYRTGKVNLTCANIGALESSKIVFDNMARVISTAMWNNTAMEIAVTNSNKYQVGLDVALNTSTSKYTLRFFQITSSGATQWFTA